MPRPLPIQSCTLLGCRKPKLGLFNDNLNPQQSKSMRNSSILQVHSKGD